jgi:hypothetical protein
MPIKGCLFDSVDESDEIMRKGCIRREPTKQELDWTRICKVIWLVACGCLVDSWRRREGSPRSWCRSRGKNRPFSKNKLENGERQGSLPPHYPTLVDTSGFSLTYHVNLTDILYMPILQDMISFLLLLALLNGASAEICPQGNHTVCNMGQIKHACVCSMTLQEVRYH